MPFKSEKQRRWMHANEPEMAKEWEKKTKKKKLPEDVKSEGFLRRLDIALGLMESSSGDLQATTRPSLGAETGPSKGSPSSEYAPKKGKKKKKKSVDKCPGGG